jgi:hypothetical protein
MNPKQKMSTRSLIGWAITLDPPIIRHDPSDALNYVLATNYYRKHLTDEEKQDFMDRVRQIRERSETHLEFDLK